MQVIDSSCGVDAEEVAKCIFQLHTYRCAYFSVLVEKINVYHRYLAQIDAQLSTMKLATIQLYRNLRSAHHLFIFNVQKIIRGVIPLLRLLPVASHDSQPIDESDLTIPRQNRENFTDSHFSILDDLLHFLIYSKSDLEDLAHGWNVERCFAPFGKTMEDFIYLPVPGINPFDASLPQQIALFLCTIEELQKNAMFHSREIKK